MKIMVSWSPKTEYSNNRPLNESQTRLAPTRSSDHNLKPLLSPLSVRKDTHREDNMYQWTYTVSIVNASIAPLHRTDQRVSCSQKMAFSWRCEE